MVKKAILVLTGSTWDSHNTHSPNTPSPLMLLYYTFREMRT